MQKKLTRDIDNKMIAGVIAGMANYFDHDVTLWRLGAVLVLFLTGFFPLVLVYLVAWIIVSPNHPVTPDYTYVDTE